MSNNYMTASKIVYALPEKLLVTNIRLGVAMEKYSFNKFMLVTG